MLVERLRHLESWQDLRQGRRNAARSDEMKVAALHQRVADGKDTYTGLVATEASGTNTNLYTRKALRGRHRRNSLRRK